MYENLSDPMPVNKEIKLYTGTGNPALAEKIADILHLELQGLNIEKFANGEIYARFTESVRGDDVYFIQTLAGSNVNDLLMETLIVCDAAKRASCSKFIAVIPHYGYARQDRKAAAREPITARLVANLLEAAGVDQVITVDLHQGQIQGFFDVPVTHLTAPVSYTHLDVYKRQGEASDLLGLMRTDMDASELLAFAETVSGVGLGNIQRTEASLVADPDQAEAGLQAIDKTALCLTLGTIIAAS